MTLVHSHIQLELNEIPSKVGHYFVVVYYEFLWMIFWKDKLLILFISSIMRIHINMTWKVHQISQDLFKSMCQISGFKIWYFVHTVHFSMQFLPYKSYCLRLTYRAGNCGTCVVQNLAVVQPLQVKIILIYIKSCSSLFFSSVSVKYGIPLFSPSAVLGAQPVFYCSLSGCESIQPVHHEKTWGGRICGSASRQRFAFSLNPVSLFPMSTILPKASVRGPGIPWCTWFSSGSEDCFLHTVCACSH